MDALLPSEVARLVLGYLEEEKCAEASKCFLDSSHHLNEYRILAQRGKKYPTKVNGCSLKEVLEEYCMVHSIVQESLSSMTDHPNGGSLIDNLRYVVRHCQPVQVHINLHPQGQNTSTGKSDTLDSSTGSTRSRSRKSTLTQGQAVENVDQTSIPQPALSSTVKESTSADEFTSISSTDTHSTAQPSLNQPQQMTSANTFCTQINQGVSMNMKFSSSNQLGFASHQNSGFSLNSDQNVVPEPNNVFQIGNVDTQSDQHPLVTTSQQSDSSHSLRTSQQLPSSTINSNSDGGMHSGAGSVDTAQTQKDFNVQEESNRSFVTKCFGSSIVFLNNDSISEPCLSENIPHNNSNQENYGSKRSHSKTTTPTKTQIDKFEIQEKFKEKILASDDVVLKLVENMNHVITPAKESDSIIQEVLKNIPTIRAAAEPFLDEFLKEYLHFDHNALLCSEDESNADLIDNCDVGKLKQLSENDVPNTSGDGSTPSKQSLVKLLNSANFTVPEGATPSKETSDGEVMTPMTKLLKSITSPNGELYLEPTQFANLIDLPASATKCKENTSQPQMAQPQHSEAYPLSLKNIIEVPQPHGPPLHIPVVECSPTEVLEYSSQEGVSTLCTIEVLAKPSSFVPIVPKLKPGDILPPVIYEKNQADQPKKRQREQRSKRCRTRGGGQSSPRLRSQNMKQKAPSTDTANLVTIYAADGEECKTVSYNGASNLPILVSDTAEVAPEVQSVESDNSVKDLPKTTEDGPTKNHDDKEFDTASTNSEDKESSIFKAEDNCLPSLSASIIRNTPGFNGPSRANEKRLSFSTPRRRLSHIRALDFNTPPKDNDQSIRRANTSPKNMSTHALSPNTTGKSIKSSLIGSLFKAPGESSQRTSKVKAHLFKSPEYPLTLSSGYRIPSTAVTSTPCEASCSRDGDTLPPPSGAWDKIGGVSLILDAPVSPVKRVPQCKKELKSWDADLRSYVSSDPQPLPKEHTSEATQKRKAPPPAQRRRTRAKKGQKTDGLKSKEDETINDISRDEKMDTSTVDKESVDKSHEMSTASDGEMAKVLENNLMDVSSEEVKNETPLMPSVTTPLKNDTHIEVQCESHANQESAAVHETSCEKLSLPEKTTEAKSTEEASEVSPQVALSNNVGNEHNPISDLVPSTGPITSAESIPSNAGTLIDACQDPMADETVSTPISDGQIESAVNKFRLTHATFKESLSFETPMKDNSFANMIPQTPRFLDPSCQSNEDTPRTKIIKAIPFPLIPSTENSASISPAVPPTPTIGITPSVSPNGVAYFQPKESPSRRTQMFKNSPKVKSYESLTSILVQESSRLEASGMREVAKKCVIEISEKEDQTPSRTEGEDVSKNLSEDGFTTKINDQGNEVIIVESTFPVSGTNEGCARLLNYKRKPIRREMNKLIIDAFHAEPTKQRYYSSDETVDCVIVSPLKATAADKSQPTSRRRSLSSSSVSKDSGSPQRNNSNRKELTSHECSPSSTLLSNTSQTVQEKECPSNVAEATSCLSSTSPSSLKTVIAEIQIQEAQEVLGTKIFGKKLSKTPSKPLQALKNLPLSPVVPSPVGENQISSKSNSSLAVSNVANLIRHDPNSPLKKPHSTPKKIKSVEKPKVLSSEKKQAWQNQGSVVTDNDDSSDSSSSGSSSDSESNSSSSSSSSEEGTPVKENVSPEKQPTPVKSQNSKSSEKSLIKVTPAVSIHTLKQVSSSKSPQCATAIAITESNSDVSDVFGLSEQEPKEAFQVEFADASTDNSSNVSVAEGLTEQAPEETDLSDIARVSTDSSADSATVSSSKQVHEEEAAAASLNQELRSLIETKDMGTCQRIASSRNAHSSKIPDIRDEMQEKRRRTVELIKGNLSGKFASKKDKVLNPFATRNKPETMKSGIVAEGKQAKVANKQQTKELNPSSGVPKTRNSKYDSKQSVQPESQVKQGKTFDTTNPNSDEEEGFKLHLSGDEKDETPQETSTQPLDYLEEQVAAIHGDVGHSNPAAIEMERVIGKEEKSDQQSKAPKASVQRSKLVVKKKASSEAADEVLKTLLEVGYGCKLPPPPPVKIRKLVPTAKHATTNENKNSSFVTIEEKSDEKIKSTSVPHNPKKTVEISDIPEAPTTEKSDKKQASVSEKSDGKTIKPQDINQNKRSDSKGNVPSKVVEEQPFSADDDQVCVETLDSSVPNSREMKLSYKGLGPSMIKEDMFIIKPLRVMMGDDPLCLTPTEFLSIFEKAPKYESTERRSQKYVSGKDRTSKSESSRRISCHRDSDNRARATGGLSRHQDSRSRRNRSPSPRFRRSSYYVNDRGSVRDHKPRRESYGRRHEAHSSHHRRSPGPEARPSESSNSRSIPMERQEVEEGEVFSSDSSDFEVKTNKRRRNAASPPHIRLVKRSSDQRITRTAKGSKESDQKKHQYSPVKVKRVTRRVSMSVVKVNSVFPENSEKENRTRKGATEKQDQNLSTSNDKKNVKDSQEEETDDVDLDDDADFPVLGDEDDGKESQQNSSSENNQSGMVTRRRAPPRSVNAHKISTVETSTPIQKGKRKLSSSPDVASEDSCHSALSSTNTVAQQSRSCKKATLGSAAPAAKISKPNDKGEKVAETEIIKNLDVESFLSKLHG